MVRRQSIVARIVFMLIASFLGAFAYLNFGTPAMVKKAGAEFLKAAVQGDKAGVQARLAVDAKMTADEAVDMFRGLSTAKVYQVGKWFPGLSEVQYSVLVSHESQSGYWRVTRLLMKLQDGRWVVVDTLDR